MCQIFSQNNKFCIVKGPAADGGVSQRTNDKRKRLRRSLSSPDGSIMSRMIVQHPRIEDDFSVTLEDVEKFKVLRKRSGGSISSNEDRYKQKNYVIVHIFVAHFIHFHILTLHKTS